MFKIGDRVRLKKHYHSLSIKYLCVVCSNNPNQIFTIYKMNEQGELYFKMSKVETSNPSYHEICCNDSHLFELEFELTIDQSIELINKRVKEL